MKIKGTHTISESLYKSLQEDNEKTIKLLRKLARVVTELQKSNIKMEEEATPISL